MPADRQRAEILRNAVDLGQKLVELADALGHPIAGNYIAQGVERLREDRDWIAVAPVTTSADNEA